MLIRTSALLISGWLQIMQLPLLLLLLHSSVNHCFYVIVAPRNLRPNSQYHVAVSVHNLSRPARLQLSVVGSNYRNIKIVEAKQSETKLLQFDIPVLKKDDGYRLIAEGLDQINFYNETKLIFDNKQFVVVIQTDKAFYKPSDQVYYRLLILDSNLRPLPSYDRIEITIRDAGNNVIHSNPNVQLVSGVYTNELQLSDYPKFGTWSIIVDVMDDMYQRFFDVVEYIQPKFVVDIDTEKHVIYNTGKIRANVKAYYPFGKAITGEATLSIYPTFFGSLQPFLTDLIKRKVLPINGSTEFSFDIRNELKLKEDYEREYLLDVLVVDHSTGAVQNSSTVITLHLDAYKIQAVHLPSYYIPNVPFEVKVRVLHSDGSKLIMRDKETELTAYLVRPQSGYEIFNKSIYHMDDNGEAKMKFVVTAGDTSDYHSIIVNYMGIITDVGKVARKYLTSNRYITAKILNHIKPIVNQDVIVMLNCNVPINYFIYQIVGRGDILLTRSILIDGSKQHVFRFLATFAMLPKAKLMIYIPINDELIYDEQTIDFQQNLLNDIQINMTAKAYPEQEIDIMISAKPFNYIGLMAVDQNAVHLTQGNDLSVENLMKTLLDYNFKLKNLTDSTPVDRSDVIIMTDLKFTFSQTAMNLWENEIENSIKNDDHRLTTIRKTDIGSPHAIEINALTPGNGRYAFSYTTKPFWHNPRIHIMHSQADTWLFTNATAYSNGSVILHKRLPNTVTNWVLTAFAIDPIQGIGSTQQLLRTIKDFYITTKMPYSIKLGEIIALPFVVFNNYKENLEVEVTFYNTANEFDLLQVDNTATKPKAKLYSSRTIYVLSKSKTSIAFIVIPKRVGTISIKATATYAGGNDVVEDTLFVEHPGTLEIINQGNIFVLPTFSDNKSINATVRIPQNAIENSGKIVVSAAGDVIDGILLNMKNVIHQPLGCGEQAMTNFVSNVLLLEYLKDTERLPSSLFYRAKRNLQLGYQRILYYRHNNGAFGAFGLMQENDSVWLTAYVAKTLIKAKKFVQIDENVIETALQYLVNVQDNEGRFQGKDDIFERFDDNDLSLSAFAVLALMESTERNSKYTANINRGLTFILRQLNISRDLHGMAIGVYAITKANIKNRTGFLQRLDAMAVFQDDLKWWNKTAPLSDAFSPWYKRRRNINIEITSYAILSLLDNNLTDAAWPAMKWLVNQRNDLGGFVGSQDTVIGLQALIEFAKKFPIQSTNLKVFFQYGLNAETSLSINAQNVLVQQSVELPNNIKNISVKATGIGFALAQLTYYYHINVTDAWPRFVLDPTVNRNSHSDYLHLSVCTSFISAEGDSNRSNMAVMEIYLPSGFVVDTDTLPTLEYNQRIKKVETINQNTVVILYFDYLDRRVLCPTLHAYKVTKIANHQSVPVIMYDYYDNVRRARQFYKAPASTICDICEHANCDVFCQTAEKQASNAVDSNKSNPFHYHSGATCYRTDAVRFWNLILTSFTIIFLRVSSLIQYELRYGHLKIKLTNCLEL